METRPTSSRQRYREFVENYRLKRLDEIAEAAGKVERLPNGEPSAEVAPDETEKKPKKRREYVREYLRWVKPHRYSAALLFFLALFTAGLQMLEPLFMRYIIDKVLLNKTLDTAGR